MSTVRHEIEEIDKRLQDMRDEYWKAAIGRKKFMIMGAKLLKDKRARLATQLENEE
jgi:hypothetical protein